ncbi:MAG: hypothetical protein KGK07_12885 [Chloroflexota bacterium]|nr:hypothetical protein [Chloroflexota bacterium]
MANDSLPHETACATCGGTGRVTRPGTLTLFPARGANLYRHGRYATQGPVGRIGAELTIDCTDCGGSGSVARVCRHCGAENLPPYDEAGCGLCGWAWEGA